MGIFHTAYRHKVPRQAKNHVCQRSREDSYGCVICQFFGDNGTKTEPRENTVDRWMDEWRRDNFSYFSMKLYVVTSRLNCLDETV